MDRPSPASLRSAPSPAGGRGEESKIADSLFPLPQAGEVSAQRRVRNIGKKSDAAVHSRRLRKEATEAERILWSRLRNRGLGGFKFSRQYPIGPYFADFVCREAALVVEVDGGQHSDSKYDVDRDKFLNSAGYTVLRFWNSEVTGNLGGVLQVLLLTLEGRPSPGLRYAPATLARRAVEGPGGRPSFSPLPPAGEGAAHSAAGEGQRQTD